jgi:6-pyruvoyltetrahydropterin/6-carboxytetrahydropterin synthase
MYRITKQFDFEAAHRLDHMPDGHPCKSLHGHSYRVEVVIESPCLDDRGFCQVDYRDLDAFKRYIDEQLDHKFLNDVLTVRTTAENLARSLFDEARKLSPYVIEVGVSETAKTWARYRSPA